ncbi:hypothetical protein OXI21_09090 [Ignatzschineria sp. RMDPL8A]|uniref:hypothetical protein n=1 Tax=Ignatzschineria sp. RMDPL8A TaxID=2999236 RepID=UPI0024467BC0|nr:hypothetical protein [Ignatzschineria sp. RMDPL8A]MDG9730568.1 hypothetical protein [Ignatzschineria sp. RMDPL8A]
MSKKGDELREHDRLSWVEQMLYPVESLAIMVPIMQEMADRNRVILSESHSETSGEIAQPLNRSHSA